MTSCALEQPGKILYWGPFSLSVLGEHSLVLAVYAVDVTELEKAASLTLWLEAAQADFLSRLA